MKDLTEQLAIIAGMPRAGTTSLYHIFATHPDIYVPFRKETAYFSYNFIKGEQWYIDLFNDRKDNQLGLDISPQYFMDFRSIKRIRAFSPSAKIILAIRNPIEWIISLYNQINMFQKNSSFESFVDGFTLTTKYENLQCQFSNGYINNTIKNMCESFAGNLLLYDFDYFNNNPLPILQSIERFLGVSSYFNESTFRNIKVNTQDRSNIRFLTWFLSRETTISLLTFLLPRPVIAKGRMLFDRMANIGSNSTSKETNPEHLKIAIEKFSEDCSFVKALFSDSPVLLGSGKTLI